MEKKVLIGKAGNDTVAGLPGTRSPWLVGALAAGVLVGGARLLSRRLPPSKSRWQGKVVFITGGSRGLGFILARCFAAHGARVAFCARDGLEIQRAVDSIATEGPYAIGWKATRERVLGLRCDVSHPDELESAIDDVTARWGEVDVLVNNASIIQVGPLDTMAEKEFREAFAVNFWPIVNSTLKVLPSMRERTGRIINITSIGGTVPVPHLLPYVATKFAAVGFSQALQIEADRHGIRVTTIVPGLMRTGSFLNALFKGDQESEFRWFALFSTIPGLSMDAERAARRIVRACERGERFVTLGAPAKALRVGFALLPALSSVAFSLVNRWMLPKDGRSAGGSAEKYAKPGYLYRTRLSSAPFTVLGDRAAEKFNQKAG